MVPNRPDRARHRGQALVEFALVIPIFLVIVMGVFDLGRAVFAYNSVTNAAREGSRLAIVNQTTTLITQRATQQSAIAETSSPNITVAYRRTSPNVDYLANAVCSTVSLDCVAVVTFETTYRPMTPVISNILFPSGVSLKATSIGQIEFVCPNANILVGTSCPKQP